MPIQRGVAGYSWVWGPEPFTPLLMEAYAQSPSGRRAVQYFDKSRMELSDPNGNPNDPWFVTNGLLVNELITGQVQTGANKFIPLDAAKIPIAGDPSNDFPTYASLERIFQTPTGRQVGDHVVDVFRPEGIGEFPAYANDAAAEIVRVERGFGIPRAFWDYMHQRGTIYRNAQLVRNQPVLNWLYVLGYPMTPAYWARAAVGGIERNVMFQAFERRVLTYTPANPAPYQVEMGNVGRHYYQWRYIDPFAGAKQAVITAPEAGAILTPPLHVQGFENASAFEGAITVRLRNIASGAIIASDDTQVMQADAGKAGPFEATLSLIAPPGVTSAVIEVVTTSPHDGSEIVLARQEVMLASAAIPEALVELIRWARQDLSQRLHIGASTIRLLSAEATEWRTSALGCPHPHLMYLQVITPGYLIILESQGQRYEYHTDRQNTFVLCQNGRPAPPYIAWEQAKRLILEGHVHEVVQLHSLDIRLILKEGRTVITTEPEIDAVFRVIEQCGERCDDIRLATE
jgi:hypothetical protein